MRRIHAATLAGIALIAALAACMPQDRAPSGKADFLSLCAGCHGPSGTGDGPAAAGLRQKPADLTTIAARHGGSFPRNQVMGRIYGYTMGTSEGEMPNFGALLEGEQMPYDPGDGIRVDTPVRLVGLMQYIETLQQRPSP